MLPLYRDAWNQVTQKQHSTVRMEPITIYNDMTSKILHLQRCQYLEADWLENRAAEIRWLESESGLTYMIVYYGMHCCEIAKPTSSSVLEVMYRIELPLAIR